MINVKKPLYRLPKQGQIAGVCAGLAEYFDFDVTLMRVIFVAGGFITGGAVVILYIILAIILPASNAEAGSSHMHAVVDGEMMGEKLHRLGKDLKSNNSVYKMRNYLGIGLLLFGAWLLLSEIFPHWRIFRWEFIWPIFLIIIGLVVIFRKGKDGK
ncbi:MAG: PspC domain-containing protein [Candidatus Saccharibacteria bacterium]